MIILGLSTTTVALSGTSKNTTALAPIFAFSPTVIPPKTFAPAPITQPSLIIGASSGFPPPSTPTHVC